MYRLAPTLALALTTLLVASNAFAADYSDFSDFGDGAGGMRSGFSDNSDGDWANTDANDPLDFQFGLRYWYSIGAQKFDIGTGDRGSMTEADKTQSVEGHFRIDDNSTRTYVKGVAGLSFNIQGTGDSDLGAISVTDGSVGYAGADIGYAWMGNKDASFGPFAGYMYWKDSPNTYHDNFTTATSAADISYNQTTGQTSFPGGSEPNNIELNMLRLGVSGKANFGPMFDVSGEIAAVPYAKISGTLGAGSGAPVGAAVSYDNANPITGPHGLTGAFNIHDIQSSPTSIDGWGYGAMAEAFVGFHPMDNWVFRIGGRAWYVQGTDDATFSRATIGDPTDKVQPVTGSAGPPVVPDNPNAPNFDTPPTFANQEFITRANPFSLFRYGVLAELTYKF